MVTFEKLGVFYLGRDFDPVAGARGSDLVLYDSKDLVTHAVCVVYLRIVEAQWDHFFELLNAAVRAQGPEARLVALTEAMFDAFEQRRGFFRLFLSERGRLSAAFSGEIAVRVGERTRRLRSLIIDLMREGCAEGLLRPLPPEMMASAYTGIVHNCIFEALASGAPRPTRSAVEVLALFLHGAANPTPTGRPADAPRAPGA